MITKTTTRGAIALPAIAAFLASLGTTTANCEAICAVKGTAAKIIPPSIRTQMRALGRLNTYWAANKAAYTALLKASAIPAGGATKAQRAGA